VWVLTAFTAVLLRMGVQSLEQGSEAPGASATATLAPHSSRPAWWPAVTH
jgi:hypothetical protein